MFKTLIGAQADILGSDSGGKTYRDLEIAKIDVELRENEVYGDPSVPDEGRLSDAKKKVTEIEKTISFINS